MSRYTPPGEVRGFRVYYVPDEIDGKTFADFRTCPSGAVGVVIFYPPPFRDIVSGGDWYFWRGGKPDKVPTHSEIGVWAPKPAGFAIKSAPMLADEVWEFIYEAMLEDRTWP